MNIQEMQYLNLIKKIINKNQFKLDRTKIGTFSTFGKMHRYSLSNSTLPVITTKKVNIQSIIDELLWFISGSTDVKKLKTKIWNANADDNGGELGPLYGFQWRHFGANFIDSNTDYKGQGIDQLAECINKIKNNPNDRRIIMTSWNPVDLKKSALPPCHCFVQFYVEKGKLSCMMYQRSADMGLGVPFNITSYCLLTHMIAHVTGLKAYEFIHTMGDAHVYINHVEDLKKQIKLTPFPFPKLEFNRKVSSIEDFKCEDFKILNYKYHDTKMCLKMAL